MVTIFTTFINQKKNRYIINSFGKRTRPLGSLRTNDQY